MKLDEPVDDSKPESDRSIRYWSSEQLPLTFIHGTNFSYVTIYVWSRYVPILDQFGILVEFNSFKE